jgi:integrase
MLWRVRYSAGTSTNRDFAASTRNKYVQMMKALFRWATKKGYLAKDPAADSDVLKRTKHAQRHRRLDVGEDAQLLANAGPHLQRLMIAALETAGRRGELLTLTWRDVSLDRREMTIRAERTKTRTARVLPISERLTAVLKMANTDPAGKEFGPEAHVFGDVIGQQVKDIKKAWETCVLKAHGHTPTWTRDNALSPASREALRRWT